MASAVRIQGYRELMTSFAKADRGVRLGVREELRRAAEPVRSSAEQYARGRIRNIGEPWSRMRVGISRSSVYVAPRERGAKGPGYQARRRPNLGTLLMDRAMQPALDVHEHETLARVDEMLDSIADRFNRG